MTIQDMDRQDMDRTEAMSPWVDVVMVRHATTDWNERGRIQGHTDISLNERGRTEASNWHFDAGGYRWIASPLKRALETARLLGGTVIESESRLREMHWGEWEGRTLAQLRRELGEAMSVNEARGLDFRPAGGESPREVQIRLCSWLGDVSTQTTPCIAVTHKGVIRALMAYATGWDMTGQPPCRLDWCSAHRFRVRAHSCEVELYQPNLALVDRKN